MTRPAVQRPFVTHRRSANQRKVNRAAADALERENARIREYHRQQRVEFYARRGQEPPC